MKKIKAIVFDFDATLASSAISKELLEDWRDQLTLDCEYYEMIEYIEALPPELAKEKRNGLLVLEQEAMKKAEIIEGTKEWLEFISKKNLHVGIFSRNTKENINVFLREKNLKVDIVIGRNDCIPKPDPAGLKMIIDYFKLNPAEVLMVGDSYVSDVQCGKKAGTLTAIVNNTEKNQFNINPDFYWETLLTGYSEFVELWEKN